MICTRTPFFLIFRIIKLSRIVHLALAIINMETSALERAYNFSAGPAVLPLSVLQRAKDELLCLPGVGASVMEISHRSKAFIAILEETEANIRKLLSIPQTHKILFMQGGAISQFAFVPMNILRGTGKTAEYIVSGTWSKKALSEGKTQGPVSSIWDGKPFEYRRKPVEKEYSVNPNAAYAYFTSNETIEGIQWRSEPNSGNVPLVCDASSDIFSRPIDVSKYGLIFACAQKNIGPAGVTLVVVREDLLERSQKDLPSVFSYKLMSENQSMVNTPPTFAIYIVKLVTEWLLNDIGGLEKMHVINKEKVSHLYNAIDTSSGFYKGHADVAYRSLMNVPFRLPSEELDKKFENEAKSHNLLTLAGHRSVGGLRASLYNAMPMDGAKALAQFMGDFARKNG